MKLRVHRRTSLSLSFLPKCRVGCHHAALECLRQNFPLSCARLRGPGRKVFFSAFLIGDTESPVPSGKISQPAHEIRLRLRPVEERLFPSVEIGREFAVVVGKQVVRSKQSVPGFSTMRSGNSHSCSTALPLARTSCWNRAFSEAGNLLISALCASQSFVNSAPANFSRTGSVSP